MTVAAVAERLGARRVGAGWLARCPAHRDRTPSLSLREGRDGRVLLRCRAGCATADVLAAACISWRDVCGDSRPATGAELARLRRDRDAREHARPLRRAAMAALVAACDRVLARHAGERDAERQAALVEVVALRADALRGWAAPEVPHG